MKNFRKYYEQYQHYLVPVALVLIIGVGVYFRTVDHSSLLVFKSDQARDALIMDSILSGKTHLPLLGPQIGGTTLRLGPAFYYFQYVSGKIFGNSPQSLAHPDLIWGVLTLPILYLLFRKFFSKELSLWLLALASSSLLLVTFSRFAWNPNGLPFFTALFSYLFLAALETEGRRRLLYLSGTAICIGIVAQLHLAAILGLVIGLGFFWVLTRSLSWKEILIMVAIVIALHAPVLVNEWQTGGESIHSLTQAKEKKLSQEKGHAIHEMIFRAYQENSSFAWLVLTGQQNTDTILTRGLKLKCDKKCEAALPYSLVAMLLFGYVLFASYRSGRLSDDTTRKRAIVFVGCWLGGFFIITIFLAYQLQTRFYLGVAVPIFIALGLAAEYLYTFNDNTWLKRIFVVLGIFIILLNITATGSFLRQLTHSQVSGEESGRDLRFGTEPKVTLGQLREIAKDARDQFSPNVPMIIFGESHYVKALYYVMSREQGFTGCYVKGGVSDIPEGYNQLFLMENKTDLDDKREDIKTFGTLASTVMRGGMYQSVQPLPQDCLDY